MEGTLPLKVLSLVTLGILILDVEVLKRTICEYFQLHTFLEEEPYQTCYKPQAQLRIVFQGYIIYGAFIATVLTSLLAFGATDNFIEFMLRSIINLSYIVFGPVLLTFVNFGLVHMKQLAFVCSPRGTTHKINFMDILLLLGCFILALCITFTMAMQKTFDMAQQSFQDENSFAYQLTSTYFSYRVRQSQQMERETLRQRQEQRCEQRRLRAEERQAALAAAYGLCNNKIPLGPHSGQRTLATSSGISTHGGENYEQMAQPNHMKGYIPIENRDTDDIEANPQNQANLNSSFDSNQINSRKLNYLPQSSEQIETPRNSNLPYLRFNNENNVHNDQDRLKAFLTYYDCNQPEEVKIEETKEALIEDKKEEEKDQTAMSEAPTCSTSNNGSNQQNPDHKKQD